MNVEGLVTVHPSNQELMLQLTNMAGDAYLNDPWVRELLAGMPRTSDGTDRSRYLARAIMLDYCLALADYHAVLCTHDGYGLAVAYQQSDLGDTTWNQIAKDASAKLVSSVFSMAECDAYEEQLRRMESVTQRDWVNREKGHGDFIQIVLTAVSPEHRGHGDFSALIEPILAYADEHELPVYTTVYSEVDEEGFKKFGFKLEHKFTSAEVPLVQRCLVRR